jgi:hypothetical protein
MEALKKALLELGRVVIIAVLPIIITSVEQGKIDWKVIGIAAIIATLKGIDKFIHEIGVAKEEETGEPSKYITGLTRF